MTVCNFVFIKQTQACTLLLSLLCSLVVQHSASVYFRPVCSDYIEPPRADSLLSSDRLQQEFFRHTVCVACLLECLRLDWGGRGSISYWTMGNSAYFRRITILCAELCWCLHNSTITIVHQCLTKGCTCVSDPIIKKLNGLKRREHLNFQSSAVLLTRSVPFHGRELSRFKWLCSLWWC